MSGLLESFQCYLYLILTCYLLFKEKIKIISKQNLFNSATFDFTNEIYILLCLSSVFFIITI